jgi:transposase
MTIVMIGIDLGKNSCSVAALDESGAVVLRRRMRPASIVEFAAKHAPCTVAMEACCGAHYMGRRLLAQGHAVKLMPPEYVRPYVKRRRMTTGTPRRSRRRQRGRRCASSS